MPRIREGIPGIRRATCIVLAISSAAPPIPSPFFFFLLDSSRSRQKKPPPPLCLVGWLLRASRVLALLPLARRAERGDRQPERVSLRPAPSGLAVAAPAGAAYRRRRPRCWRTRLPSCCRSTSATTSGGSTRRR
jgi:hypothetical protein